MSKPIDATDRKILNALIADGRQTTNDLSQRVGLTPSPCWQRVRRLEREGYIKGYTTLVDFQQLGYTDTVLIDVTLNRHDEDVLRKFGTLVAALPEVMDVSLTTGEFDYFIKVAVKGAEGLEDFLFRKLYKIGGIQNTRTSFVIRSLKDMHAPSPL
ncbi:MULTISPECIES: Lrp/AsnC family transcriptional regulator [unclassified Mesorhizobium]|uniref:Lrp/AsnC family transcriptional regulator n=1 Tax=unclassified Mesorhizobium TaxID=325217 RepID=UPI0006FA3761|nr:MULTISPECIES: Lrp/AsnC family transcriptional regulator [unclassified Mesorhizobium]KQZ15145.1 AsnC family transcriptional regulator [Mesorhizobium sp. Root1471]KQZ37653.1 AsnC family transcriptional regulator [Mesorhizobium sp. Root554]MDR7033712.1 Lrp/AsnC family leucine-responsive transcriptional regulator [Mesorhizobium sp. BE184]